MGVSDQPADVAFATLARNPAGRWYRSGIDVDDQQGGFAVQRLKHPGFPAQITPSFTIDPSDRVFAIGSCFARGIEKTLVGRGFDVVSAAKEFDDFVLSGPNVTGLGFTNKYTTFSILNDLAWALDPESPFPTDSIVDLDEYSVDPHTNPTLKYVDRARTEERRSIIEAINRRIATCRVVMMTLGLVECWYDSLAGVSVNMTPSREMLDAFPDRYWFHLSDQAESRDNLDQIHSILSKFGHPDLQLVITVSPVPLMATFTDRDIVVANAYSKSTLRSAAEEFAFAHENVHYFPSYEMVINSSPEFAWEPDGRHVRGEMTQFIMKRFVDAFVAS